MQAVAATFRNGRVELTELVDWPEGTRLEVVPQGVVDNPQATTPMTAWPNSPSTSVPRSTAVTFVSPDRYPCRDTKTSNLA